MRFITQELPVENNSSNGIREAPPPGQDSLIARGLQKEQYVAISVLAVIVFIAIGIFSRRVEYAILFAVILSAILIAFFLFI
ncbi:hypothetical protein AMR41_11640 [Hapalosiphon sp. MRB220]|nr:hypothetical protein AMR41_11640 [Hapalosiphon sp. MRB220]